jgi:redox-sensitive bicupin YhaK (pirin superfamily)
MVLHVQVQPGATWTCTVPSHYDTALLYIRQGGLEVRPQNSEQEGAQVKEGDGHDDDREVLYLPAHSTVYFESDGGDQVIVRGMPDGPCDFVFMAGEAIREPCAMQGSMVMNTESEIERAYLDYSRGMFGVPWDHSLSENEWRRHLAETSSRRI